LEEQLKADPPYFIVLGNPAAEWNPWELCGPKMKRGEHWDRMRRQGQKVIKWISDLGGYSLQDGRAILIDGRWTTYDEHARLANPTRDGVSGELYEWIKDPTGNTWGTATS